LKLQKLSNYSVVNLRFEHLIQGFLFIVIDGIKKKAGWLFNKFSNIYNIMEIC